MLKKENISPAIREHYQVDLPEGSSPHRNLPVFGTVNFAKIGLEHARSLEKKGCKLLIPITKTNSSTKTKTNEK